MPEWNINMYTILQRWVDLTFRKRKEKSFKKTISYYRNPSFFLQVWKIIALNLFDRMPMREERFLQSPKASNFMVYRFRAPDCWLQMGSEIEEVEERLKSFTGQLQTECGILERLVYKHKNQHRRCSYFQYILKVCNIAIS